LFANSPGTTVLHLDTNGLYKIRIPKFAINEQVKIIEKLKKFETSISICQLNMQSSQSLQKSLINQVF
jgi:type I restriction enzyme S subunit